MNIWAAMLADLPATAQRTIARFQRVSLPRGCTADERLLRLRTALCRAKAVRAVYLTLDAATRAAIQDLRRRPRGLRPDDVTARYGPLRPWSHLAADPQPQSITEHLVLLGWLIMRPAAPRNPPRLLVPPEVRRWVPQPLVWQTCGDAPPQPIPPALAAATTLLLACAAAPLAVRTNGTLRPTTLRTLLPRLQPLAPAAPADLGRFVWQVLLAHGLVTHTGGRATLSPAGSLFLAAPPATQIERLRTAWAALPGPDPILAREMLNTHGLDWPLLCRRLQLWAAALPAGKCVDPASTYATLSAAYGLLADAMTHGFRRVTRAPWQPRRAEAIWLAALHGPLHWLGLAGALCDGGRQTADGSRQAVDGSRQAADGGRRSAVSGQWSVVSGRQATLFVPHGVHPADLARIVAALDWVAADAEGSVYRLDRRSLARGVRAGVAVATVIDVLIRHLGALPADWLPDDVRASAQVRLRPAVVITAPPGVLEQAARARSVRRYLAERPAPGIALVDPKRIAALDAVFQRQGLLLVNEGVTPDPVATPEGELSAGERAALVLACTYLNTHAPQAALTIAPALLRRLEHDLPAPLRTSLAQAIADLGLPEPPAISRPWQPQALLDPAEADAWVPGPVTLDRLRHAIGARACVELLYQDAAGITSVRTVRPLTLEQRGDQWYMAAHCDLAHAERTFRVDRIAGMRAAV